MGMCKECGEVLQSNLMTNGFCPDCLEKGNINKLRTVKIEEIKNNKQILDSILITTETTINQPIEKRVGVISSQCVYGLNIVKDIFASIRNIVGGRIQSIEEALEKANIEIIEDLKTKAYMEDCNAVIGLKIEHTYNNANNGSILSVFATGTIVKISHGKI